MSEVTKSKSKKNVAKWLWFSVFFLMGILICFLIVYFIILKNGVAILEKQIDKFETTEATLIFDQNGEEVAKLYRENGNRESVTSSEIPEILKDAFIATEDQRFESHSGVDFWSIGRAIVSDIRNNRLAEGGSTITQQLAKNVFLSSEKTFFRKATELSIAVAIEAKYSKEQILEKYLNRIYFGSGAYGIKAASKVYFNQSELSRLQLWQIATLATLPKAPSRYSPLVNPDLSKERRAIVLRLMEEQGYITIAERQAAEEIVYVPPKGRESSQYASYIDYVVLEAERLYGISEEELLTKGYRITTAMNKNVQNIMEQTYANPKLFQEDAKDGVKIQSSMVILDHRNGTILGLIGGRDYTRQSFNRVTSLRQPGSAIKPISVFAPAIETGKWNPYSSLNNLEQEFGSGAKTYRPRNYNNEYSEKVTMIEAARKSINVASVWLLDQIGVKRGFDFSNRMGLQLDPGDRNLSLALGGITRGVSPLQMAAAYGAFANEGYYHQPHAILKIEDNQNLEIAKYNGKSKKVMQPETAYYIRLMLEDVVKKGTGQKANLKRPVAGKTGSTNLTFQGLEKYDRDVWFVGFTPEWTAAVWQGFDKTDNKHFVYVGSSSTASIFREVMGKALAKEKVVAFEIPDGVEPLVEPIPSVSNLQAIFDVEQQAVKLTWTPISELYQYEVYRKKMTDSQFQLITQVELPEAIDAVMPDTDELYTLGSVTYEYAIIAVNPRSNQKSEQSEIVQLKLSAELFPTISPSPTPDDLFPTSTPTLIPSPTPTPTPTLTPTESPAQSPIALSWVPGISVKLYEN